MRIVWLGLMLLGACDFPSRSVRYACDDTADCEAHRVCDDGYCVVGVVDAPAPDATIDMPPDSNPFAMQCEAAGYTYAAVPAGYYRSVGNNASWTNAQAACKADVAGASHLIVLSKPEEVTYMATQLGWVGLSDRATENQFITVTGEVDDQRPWGTGQPDNGGGGEDCAHVRTGGQLDDDECGNGHRYVCECDGKASTP